MSAGTLAEMLDERRHLIELAHRMSGAFGSSGSSGAFGAFGAFGAETMADRVVQETYRRWYSLTDEERTAITTPRAWLTKVAGSICLDLLAAPGTAEPIVGPGDIPHLSDIPGVSGTAQHPELDVTPDGISRLPGIPGDTPQPGVSGTARQPGLVAGPEFASGSAHRQTGVDQAALDEHDRVVRRFAEVCALGDVAALRGILATGATAVSDGGGKLRAAVHPVYGADAVARFVVALLAGQPGTEVAAESVNGRTGLVLRQAGQAVAVVGMSVAGAMATAVWIVLNPDKLQPWHRP
ncbi:hypothetical protein [Streptosporangium saharense]|uniref:hypothetical protein n=1 Tax=Streptosporangium saharense TaxID=1706840 RepID=UPI0033298D5C